MISGADSNRILNAIEASSNWGSELRAEAMSLISKLPGYSWSGIYRLEGATLELDEFVGERTDHTHIPVGRGVCGAAVAENANQVVNDVRELDNYLSCSIKTKSEIVVLVKNEEGSILGQIDIDGHEVGAFDRSDEHFLESVGEFLAIRW
jgi:GAF domain-containing protein